MEKITRKQAVDFTVKCMGNAHRWHIEDAAHLRRCISALREPVEADPATGVTADLVAACQALYGVSCMVSHSKCTAEQWTRLLEARKLGSAALAKANRPAETDPVKDEALFLIRDALAYFDGDSGARTLIGARLREFVDRIGEPAEPT